MNQDSLTLSWRRSQSNRNRSIVRGPNVLGDNEVTYLSWRYSSHKSTTFIFTVWNCRKAIMFRFPGKHHGFLCILKFESLCHLCINDKQYQFSGKFRVRTKWAIRVFGRWFFKFSEAPEILCASYFLMRCYHVVQNKSN